MKQSNTTKHPSEPTIAEILNILVKRQEAISRTKTAARKIIAARLSSIAKQKPKWSYSYIAQVQSTPRMSPKIGSPFYHAVLSLWYRSDPNRKESFYRVEVRVPKGFNVQPGAILRRNSRKCSRPGCGNEYSPGPSQKYCCKHCRILNGGR